VDGEILLSPPNLMMLETVFPDDPDGIRQQVFACWNFLKMACNLPPGISEILRLLSAVDWWPIFLCVYFDIIYGG